MPTPVQPSSAESRPEVFDYAEVRVQLDRLLTDWKSPVNSGGATITDSASAIGISADQFKGEETTARIRRELRRDNRDLPLLRAQGSVSPADNYIPRRVIDRQISQEKPAQLGFLEQPDRLLVFKDLTDPTLPAEDLEYAFTDHMRYSGWTIPWHRAFDGCDLHGGVCLEVRVDETKPFKCAVEYIRREDLIFACDASDIQGNEYILRRYRFMPFEVEGFVKKWGFNEAAVRDIIADSKDRRHQKLEIFKCFCKKNGIVYIFWYSTKCQSAFLKDPVPLDLGIKDPNEIEAYIQAAHQYETMAQAAQMDPTGTAGMLSMYNQPPVPPQSLPEEEYPIFFLPYEVIEDDRLLATKGLAFRHRSDQEAVTELWTGLINAVNKAKDVYASYANNPLDQTGLKDSEKIQPNTIMQRETKFWNFPYPDAMLLGTVQAFENNISANTNRVNFAALNRQDANKTAQEIRSSEQATAALTSVGISGQSLTILYVYELCWKIGRSYALIGEIPTFPISRDRLLHTYSLASAGDSDVLRREQRKQIIRETFQYVQGTPIGNQFLMYLVTTFFPEQARKWLPVLEAQDPLQLIQAAFAIISTVPRDTLSIDQNNQLEQILGLFQQYITTRTGQANVPVGTPQLAESSSDTPANNLPKAQGGAISGASGG